MISPIGNSLAEFRRSLQQGKSGAGPVTRFPAQEFPVKVACEVKGFRPDWRTKVLDPFIQYALAASEQAVQD
ncbi:MAG: beta-ketoacyl-[acyl-carrier-protein] synthase II, partial [Candidatus Omnitrophica bacterium]|nr:beta-ketoacyl-[acyl-carrier-protein] synthase II [Candidatus Omnitrophota bacterium]